MSDARGVAEPERALPRERGEHWFREAAAELRRGDGRRHRLDAQEVQAAQEDKAPPKPFSTDVKTQNRWVQNVTEPAVERVRKFSKTRLTTLDDVELLELNQPVPKLDSPRSIKACLEMGVDPTAYDLCVVDGVGCRDDRIDESIWMLRYEHAQRKRENLLVSLQEECRHSFSEREALNEFRPAKGKIGAVESTVVAANDSMSVQISSHRNERFHEKTRHWERTHQKVLAMEHQRQKDGEYKTGKSEAYIKRSSR